MNYSDFERLGVVLSGHFKYASELHGEKYFDKDVLSLNPMNLSHACHLIAERFDKDNVEVVFGAASGGIPISQWVAFHSRSFTKRPVFAAYAEKTPAGEFTIRLKFAEAIYRKRILVVEDTINTGGTVKKIIALARFCGGEVVGVGGLCNRKLCTADTLQVPKIETLVEVDWAAWLPDDCLLCKKGIPIHRTVGHGRRISVQGG